MSKQTKLAWTNSIKSSSLTPDSLSASVSSIQDKNDISKRGDRPDDDDDDVIIIIDDHPVPVVEKSSNSKVPIPNSSSSDTSTATISSSLVSSASTPSVSISSTTPSALSILMKTAKANYYGDTYRLLHQYIDKNNNTVVEGSIQWLFNRTSPVPSTPNTTSISLPIEIKFPEMVNSFRIRMETNNCPCGGRTASNTSTLLAASSSVLPISTPSSSSSLALPSSTSSTTNNAPYSSLASTSTITLSPSMWKSCLQKCIRRGLVFSALRIGKEMWYRDPVDLVRRLMIIIIEDSILHPAYPFLAWLLLLSSAITDRTFALCLHHYGNILFQIINEITTTNVRDDPSVWDKELQYYENLIHKLSSAPVTKTTSTTEGNITKKQKIDTPILSVVSSPQPVWKPIPWITKDYELYRTADDNLSSTYGIYIKALLIRKRFGGMTFDTHMLQQASCLWYYRFWCDNNFQYFPADLQTDYTVFRSRTLAFKYNSLSWLDLLHQVHQRVIPNRRNSNDSTYFYSTPFMNFNSIPKVTRKDIPLQGIDFHCSNMYEFIMDVINNKYTQSTFPLSPSADSYSLSTFRSILTKIYEKINQSSTAQMEKYLYTMIWNYRSSLNHRQVLNDLSPPSSILTTSTTLSASSSSSEDDMHNYYTRLEPFIDAFSETIIQQRFR